MTSEGENFREGGDDHFGSERKIKVTILHPDLGIGGAERLIVDAAHALRDNGHAVDIVTNRFSANHCFSDVLEFKDRITVIDWFPRSFFGLFCALCAYIRICLAAAYVCYTRTPDVILCDQISAPLYILKKFSKAKLLFYCHFPDKYLAKRDTSLKRLYRSVIDRVEERTTGMADVVLLNSHFTLAKFKTAFPSLRRSSALRLDILHPSLNTAHFDELVEKVLAGAPNGADDDALLPSAAERQAFERVASARHIFVSLNRFEEKKNILLAIEAFEIMREHLTEDIFNDCLLVVAGGYDVNCAENVWYHQKLVDVVKACALEDRVLFMLSPSDAAKVKLLLSARLVVYTPENEHFGIVPLEAMYLGRPVLAVKSGGPKETIVDGETGLLRLGQPREFAESMLRMVQDVEWADEYGENGRRHVLSKFSFDAFSTKLNGFVNALVTGR